MKAISVAKILEGSRPTRGTSPSDSPLISYRAGDTTPPQDRQGAAVAPAGLVAEEDGDHLGELSERPTSWRGLNLRDPLPWQLQATRPPTRALDLDFTPEDHPYSLLHSEYGHDENPEHRSDSAWGRRGEFRGVQVEEPHFGVYLATYISYAVLHLFGHIRELFCKIFYPGDYTYLRAHDGYAPLFTDYESFYSRRMKARVDDIFSRPVHSVCGRTATLIDRTSSDFNLTFTYTGETTQALNVSSYNYLGFAQSRGPCADQASRTVATYGVSTAGPRSSGGTSELHIQCERLMASFLGVEDCMVVAMGFATNSTTIPALVSEGCLIVSDELNHASIRFGAKLSGATIRQYKHNDMHGLEKVLRRAMVEGRPQSHAPWKKILVVVEGLYSMEGDLSNLPRIMELKAKYKFYLFIDEAHSIGAIGPRGRGVCDYFDVEPRSVDILMGTFSKSFGSAGGFIAGTHQLISALRTTSHAENYAEAMAPPVLTQIITATASIMGPAALSFAPDLALLPAHLFSGAPGLDRIRRLAFASRYVHGCLRKLGFIIYGSVDSPIVPLLVFGVGKCAPFSRLMLTRHNIIVVIAAFPA
ncbi:hypothetical protein RQP46_002196 [Phenoliferia psychrophenolica]